MFVNVRNAPRVVIPPPTQNTTCFAVCALVCDFSPKAECVPAFTRESERGPFVREVEKRNEERLGDKIYGGSFAGFSPSADGEGSQRTGKCMYIKARWNKRDFAGSAKPHYVRRRECPCFGVRAAVCDLYRNAECVPIFTHESECGLFVREVEKRDEKRFEMELVAVTFWRYLRERFWTKNRTLQEVFSSGEGRSILVQDKERCP